MENLTELRPLLVSPPEPGLTDGHFDAIGSRKYMYLWHRELTQHNHHNEKVTNC